MLTFCQILRQLYLTLEALSIRPADSSAYFISRCMNKNAAIFTISDGCKPVRD